MIRCDAVIAGGGPAGSTCARVLRRAGWQVRVLDRARFPRDKVCAGWVTPGAFEALELDPGEYRAAGLTLQEITAFRTGLIDGRLLETDYRRTVSYAIRRCEFDDFLLRRAGASVHAGTPVETLERKAGVWVVNGAFEAPVVIGAGGHFCPVARHLRGGPDAVTPVVAKEAEFRIDPRQAARLPAAPELYFCADLEGYAWCVRKGEYVNIGIGRRGSQAFAAHVRDFMAFVAHRHGMPAAGVKWKGHAYLAAGSGARPIVGDGLLLVGDAAGLAYPESGEGIRPAIESGHLAGEVLARARGRVTIEDLRPYADAIAREHPPSPPTRGAARAISVAAGRLLMRSPSFTRHVLLDRWFLRARRPAEAPAGGALPFFS